MTPDQLHQVMVELSGMAAAVYGNGWWRKRTTDRQCDLEIRAADRLETEAQLLREEMRATRDELVRLKDRMAEAEKSDERLRVEMHALTGRVDAANETYTQILQKAKDREAKAAASQTVVTLATKPDLQDQTKITVKKEEKK